MKRYNLFDLVIFVVMLSGALSVCGQDVQTRSITSDDFVGQRPSAVTTSKSGKASSKTRARRLTYRFVRADRNVMRHKSPKKTSAANLPLKVTEVGITIWKLRPPKPGEVGVMLPVKGDPRGWLAERVADDVVFKSGDRVRFAIESSSSGYLYVFDRETYSDGSFGEPLMIFPDAARVNENNSVRPGMLFDIPDQREELPYFNMSPRKDTYSGEMLTIVISPKPMTSFSTDANGRLKQPEVLTALEFGAQVEIFSRSDNENKVFSRVEAESTCGAKTRETGQASDRSPCGVLARQLTRDEPLPQSIYRVTAAAGEPAVAFVKLTVR